MRAVGHVRSEIFGFSHNAYAHGIMESWTLSLFSSGLCLCITISPSNNEWMNELNHSPSPLFFEKKKNYFICLVKYIPFYALPLNVQFFNFNYLHFCLHLSRAPELYALFCLSINVHFNDLSEWIRKFHTLPVAHVIISLLISNHSTSRHKTWWLQQISYNQNDILQSLPHEWELFTFYERPRVRFFLSFPFANANVCS